MKIQNVNQLDKDTCYYPYEEVYLHKSNGEDKVYSKQSILEKWTFDPNEK